MTEKDQIQKRIAENSKRGILMADNKMLLDESPLIVLPTLAVMIGLNNAIALQQLNYLLKMTEKVGDTRKFIDGCWWVYNSYPDWCRDYFKWWSDDTVKRIFTELEGWGLVISAQLSNNKRDRRKWYRIAYERFNQFTVHWTRWSGPVYGTNSAYRLLLEFWLHPHWEPDGADDPYAVDGANYSADWLPIRAICTNGKFSHQGNLPSSTSGQSAPMDEATIRAICTDDSETTDIETTNTEKKHSARTPAGEPAAASPAFPGSSVVNFKDIRDHWDPAAQQWDSPQYVYIGRANSTYKLPESKWRNPTRIGQGRTREMVIQEFRQHMRRNPDLRAALPELAGKILVCWCAPDSCHGDILLEMLAAQQAMTVEHKDKIAMIAAWWEALPVRPASVKTPYNRKPWQDWAERLVKAGLTPAHVKYYVEEQTKAGAFFADKSLSWTYVADNLPQWIAAHPLPKPAPEPKPAPDEALDETLPPVPEGWDFNAELEKLSDMFRYKEPKPRLPPGVIPERER